MRSKDAKSDDFCGIKAIEKTKALNELFYTRLDWRMPVVFEDLGTKHSIYTECNTNESGGGSELCFSHAGVLWIIFLIL